MDEQFNPTLVRLLMKFQLGKRFVRGRGHCLFDQNGKEYLDFTAQYGAIPFGYNPPELWDVFHKAKAEEIPSLVQPSIPISALELAKLLEHCVPRGLKISTFAQGGAGAIEVAIKLARSTTKKQKILSTVNGFHGKTLGALSATGQSLYQIPFGAPAENFETIPFNDLDALEKKIKSEHKEIAAFFVEPIQAEAGVQVPKKGYLRGVADICQNYNVLFVLDEIQTGLGRTGRLWACDSENISPDIMTIGKALGGGLLPLSVCLCKEEVWNDDFGRLHSSTFANNNLACLLGEKVIHLLLKNDRAIIRRVDEIGDYLIHHCHLLQEKFPRVIKEVRGVGLLVALELRDISASDSFHMAYLSKIGAIPALLAGYLLNVEFIRILPFLNNNNAIRLEPSLTIDDASVNRVIETLHRLCDIIDGKDYGLLHEYLVVDHPPRRTPISYKSQSDSQPETRKVISPNIGNFAFLIHYTALEDLLNDMPRLRQFPIMVQERLWNWVNDRSEIAELFFLPALTSKSGAICQGWIIGIPLTSDQLKTLPRSETLPLIQSAIQKAKSLGARIVGLGAFTAVASRGGLDLAGSDVAITTGNCLTVALALDGLLEISRVMGADMQKASVAIIGANGSLGRACAQLLLEHVHTMVLVGNPNGGNGGFRRMETLRTDLQKLFPNACLSSTLELSEALRQADLVVVASSALSPIIFPKDLKEGAVVCDLSRPANVSTEVDKARRDVLVFEGGFARLPEPVMFGTNWGLSPGVSFACLAETMLIALEGEYKNFSVGNLNLAEVQHIKNLAKKHGIQLGPLYVNDREITPEEIATLRRKKRESSPQGTTS